MMATLGATIVRGESHRRAIELLAPGHDIGIDRPDWRLSMEDLYPDALPTLRRLREAGFRLGAVGNQPATSEVLLGAIGVDLEIVASSETWGVAKPAGAFFLRVAQEFGLDPASVLYVGDRLDNDVLPAVTVGMHAVLLRRGPWAVQHAEWDEAARADAVLGSLVELADWLTRGSQGV